MILDYVSDKKLKLPSRMSITHRSKIDTGATVLLPPKEIVNWVIVLDFSQHYPRIIDDFNLGVDTLDENGAIVSSNGARFKSPREKRSILSSFIRKLLQWRYSVEAERKKYDVTDPEYKQLSDLIMAIKGRINSIYGVMGFSNFRLRHAIVGESVTANGRKGLEIAINTAKEHGYLPIYGDTDSIFVQIPEPPPSMDTEGWYIPVIERVNELTIAINENIHRWEKSSGVENPSMEMSFEALFDKVAFFGVKKKYFASIVYDGKKGDIHKFPLKDRMKVRGFEVRRSDSSVYTKLIQEKLMMMIMENKSRDEIYRYIRQAYLDIVNKKISYRLLLRGKKLKSVREDSTANHVRAYFHGTETYGWSYQGYIYLLNVKSTKENNYIDTIGLPSMSTEIPDGLEIDYEVNAEKVLKSTVDLMLSPLDISWTEVRYGFKTNKITPKSSRNIFDITDDL